jgi:pimeloyl-ACP methyl ester carboxylesterase
MVLNLLVLAMMAAAPEEVSFPAKDGGTVFADLYGSGDRGVILAHGARFDKASWKDQATRLAASGFHVAAIDFRGYGKSKAGPNSNKPSEELYLDVLAAVQYLRAHGASTVAVIGGSMGGGASANAVVEGGPGAIDRLILLAPVPIKHPERLNVPKLYLTAQDDTLTPQIREQFRQAPEPKELIVLEGSAHAQFLFKSDQGERVMKEILRFLAAK